MTCSHVLKYAKMAQANNITLKFKALTTWKYILHWNATSTQIKYLHNT